MPIRINLLAEAQAAEEERRKDPVKRGTYLAGAFVCLVVLWAVVLQLRVMGAKHTLNGLEAKWKAIEQGYDTAVAAQRKNIEAEQRLDALQAMTTNRFLWGNVLNAFQQTLVGVPDVQVMRIKTEQTYAVIEGTETRTNGTQVIPATPARATEKVLVTVDARDSSQPSGNRVSDFKSSIGRVPFFAESLEKTNGVRLVSRSAPQEDAFNQTFVSFSLKCFFPEKTR